jgi:hypothetical protein
VGVEASVVWRADGLARTSQVAVGRTGSVEVALLAEFLETVVGKLLVCVDVRVRVWLCGEIVKLGHLVRRGPALGRAVAIVAAGVRAVGATQGLWIDVFSAVLVARGCGLGWLQLDSGLSVIGMVIVSVADIIRIALAASDGKHGIKETLVQSRVGLVVWEAISRGHAGARAWAEGGRTGRAGVLSEKLSGGAEYCDGQGTAAQRTTQVALRPNRGGGAQDNAIGQIGGSHDTGARLIARVCRLGGGEETKRCKNEHVPARVVNGAMMIHHE